MAESATHDIPDQMTAVEITEPGGPQVLKPCSRPVPEPAENQLLIKVAAAGVNRPDCLQRKGGYAPPPGASDIPGLEVAGTVVALGEGVDAAITGRRVMALIPGGGYAEYAVADAGSCLDVPDGLSDEEAAVIPETFFTVWHNVFQRGGLAAGETLLVHGGSSGIGTTAIQLAKQFDASVIVTAGSAAKCRACLDLGADHAIHYREEDFVARVGEITGDRGVDVILDMVGGPYVERNYDAAAMDGRIVQIAFLGGVKSEVNFGKLMRKRLTHTGSTLRPRSSRFKAALADELRGKVLPKLASGAIRPVMDQRFPLADAAGAHARMEAGEHIGKIVLTVE